VLGVYSYLLHSAIIDCNQVLCNKLLIQKKGLSTITTVIDCNIYKLNLPLSLTSIQYKLLSITNGYLLICDYRCYSSKGLRSKV